MGELVDKKGRVRFFCRDCGGVSHNAHHCIECEPPDTVRENRGPKWWSRDWPRSRRPPLSRAPISGIAPPVPNAEEQGFDPDNIPPRRKSDNTITGECRALRNFIDGIRDIIGLEPLYAKPPDSRKRIGSGAHYDERDGAWKG